LAGPATPAHFAQNFIRRGGRPPVDPGPGSVDDSSETLFLNLSAASGGAAISDSQA
jgi:hypothetical protein